MKLRHSILPLAAASLVVGCAINVPEPRTAASGPAAAESAWAQLLSKRVDAQGRVDFAGIAAAPADLETFVAYVGAVSPQSAPASYPTREATLAYYLNAYNALAMYDVIQSGIPTELDSIKIRFFYRNRLRMGGRRISLYALENELVRPMGDPRVHFALNCMVRGCPRLPRTPFSADKLDAELDAAAKLFLNEPRNVALLPDKRVVRFSEILRFYTSDFLSKAPTLIAYANAFRDEPIPDDWKVEFIPYDWTLNKQ